MDTQKFLEIVTSRVQEGLVDILKKARSDGKTLDDVITLFEKGQKESILNNKSKREQDIISL